MYDAAPDPYCYPGTTVLKNHANIRHQETLDAFENDAASIRAEEPYPNGRLSVRHYKALHHHLFQDVYRWAGQFRKVRISKGGSAFCYPEHIPREMRRLFTSLHQQRFFQGLAPDDFASNVAHFLADLNALHPFREGNGRTQLAFLALLAEQAGHPIDLEQLQPTAIMAAMIDSFSGNEAPLASLIRGLMDI